MKPWLLMWLFSAAAIIPQSASGYEPAELPVIPNCDRILTPEEVRCYWIRTIRCQWESYCQPGKLIRDLDGGIYDNASIIAALENNIRVYRQRNYVLNVKEEEAKLRKFERRLAGEIRRRNEVTGLTPGPAF